MGTRDDTRISPVAAGCKIRNNNKKSLLHEDFHCTDRHYATPLLCQTEEGCILISNKNTLTTGRHMLPHHLLYK
jgi:hypothetical protein